MGGFYVVVLSAVAALCGCSVAHEISDTHPYAKSLLVTCTTSWPIYLYGSRWESGYWVFTEKIKGYAGPAPTQIAELSEPAMTLLPGTTITGTHLKFESTMGTGPAIWIYGIAHPPSGEDQRVRDVVELVGIDLVEWQKEHPFRLLPPVSEYVKKSTKGEPKWCEP
jgi:hypothetical protein